MDSMNLKGLLFWIITYSISLGFVEIGLRVIYLQTPLKHPLAIVSAFYDAKNFLGEKTSGPTPEIGIWEKDSKYGYSHVANSSGIHTTQDFSVKYTIDNNGARTIPIPEGPLGRILFLGGSYTFGHGVNDDEVFPYILSTNWPRWRIDNRGVMGWGTSHAYMTLLEEMVRNDRPAMVVYTMIPHHITRNYIRRGWVKSLSKFDRDHPHFELIEGEPTFMGVIGVDKSLPGTPELRGKEIELTRAFLVEMQNICRENQVPFIVVFLEENHSTEITEAMVESDIQFVDLSGLEFEGIEYDPHPGSADHKKIAEMILTSSISETLKSVEAKGG
jgi:hypothetical protein